MAKRFKVIVNPSSGVPRPILSELNNAFYKKDIYWEVDVTLGANDAMRFSQDAVNKKMDAVIVYGGDGTVMSAGSGLIGTGIPMLVLRGGTGNVVAAELNIPKNIPDACSLLFSGEGKEIFMDVGKYQNGYFFERISFGIEAEMMKGAPKEKKKRIGNIAYAVSAFHSMLSTQVVKYEIDYDGQKLLTEGVSCIVANTGNMGLPNLRFAPDIDITDGEFDVIILHRLNVADFFKIATYLIDQRVSCDSFSIFRAKEVKIKSDPVQTVQCDGEIISQSDIQTTIIPKAIKVIVPAFVKTFENP